jgi:hypothetical protein
LHDAVDVDVNAELDGEGATRLLRESREPKAAERMAEADHLGVPLMEVEDHLRLALPSGRKLPDELRGELSAGVDERPEAPSGELDPHGGR